MKIDGGCYCGYIKYEAEAELDKARICHCTDCQTATGSAFRTVLIVPGESFKLLAGEPTLFIKTADSGNKREQGFCPKCGTPIYSRMPNNAPGPYVLRLGSVRQRNQFVPQSQIWSRSRQAWLKDLESIKKIEMQT
jgi:hypothetical protein